MIWVSACASRTCCSDLAGSRPSAASVTAGLRQQGLERNRFSSILHIISSVSTVTNHLPSPSRLWLARRSVVSIWSSLAWHPAACSIVIRRSFASPKQPARPAVLGGRAAGPSRPWTAASCRTSTQLYGHEGCPLDKPAPALPFQNTRPSFINHLDVICDGNVNSVAFNSLRSALPGGAKPAPGAPQQGNVSGGHVPPLRSWAKNSQPAGPAARVSGLHEECAQSGLC